MNTLHIILGAGILWLLIAAAICIYLCLLFDDQEWQQAYERRAALRAAGSVAGQSGERSSTAHPVNAPQRRRVFDTEELDAIRWDWILDGGRKAERRHRR